MVKFYTNQELSHLLKINLAKWKRWSRHFLAPDPLGGLQSGYARQYHPDDAFTVFLGGYLVANLKFTLPEAKQILTDLNAWLTEKGFYTELEESAPKRGAELPVEKYIVFIGRRKRQNPKDGGFFYTVKGIISDTPAEHQGIQIREERYVRTSIPPQESPPDLLDAEDVNVLDISGLRMLFYKNLDI